MFSRRAVEEAATIDPGRARRPEARRETRVRSSRARPWGRARTDERRTAELARRAHSIAPTTDKRSDKAGRQGETKEVLRREDAHKREGSDVRRANPSPCAVPRDRKVLSLALHGPCKLRRM